MTNESDKLPPASSLAGLTSRQLAVACYRVILGREPENEMVLEQAQSLATPEAMLTSFLSSAEYKQRLLQSTDVDSIQVGHRLRSLNIQTDVPPAVLTRLFERIQQQWTELAETEPYWSILTDEDFKLKRFPKNRGKFEASGLQSSKELETAFLRANASLPTGTCLELGCGVGRVTHRLCERFDHVIGIDVAAGNLQLCRDYLKDHSISNAELRLLKSVAELTELPEFDLFYSVIVLQHNPPPVIKFMLKTLLGKIRPGGAAYFQLPTHLHKYKFKAESYLKGQRDVMDMHALPMPEIFDCFTEAGLIPREVLADDNTGLAGSHTFLATKPLG